MSDEVALFINPKLNAPEPTPDFVTTTGLDLFLKGFLIYDNNAVLADKLNLGETRKVLNINDLTKGLYAVSIQNKDFIATQKFVKN